MKFTSFKDLMNYIAMMERVGFNLHVSSLNWIFNFTSYLHDNKAYINEFYVHLNLVDGIVGYDECGKILTLSFENKDMLYFVINLMVGK